MARYAASPEAKGVSFLCQNVLAIAADKVEVLGLADKILHRHDDVLKDESLGACNEREPVVAAWVRALAGASYHGIDWIWDPVGCRDAA